MQDTISILSSELLAFLIGSILGLFFGQIKELFTRYRFRNWSVVLMYASQEILTRRISPGKISEIFDEPYEKAVYVKGVISPYGRLHCDPLETNGLIVDDHDQRKLIINLDKDENFDPYPVLTAVPQPPPSTQNDNP